MRAKPGSTQQSLLKQQAGEVGTWGRVVKERLNAVLENAGERVIDLGCSSGGYVLELQRRGYQALGCDLLVDSSWAGESSFVAADIAGLPFSDNAFDTCTAFEILEHVLNVDAVLTEIRRIVSKNLILSVPDCKIEPILKDAGLAYFHWTDQTHQSFFTAGTLEQALQENGFRLKTLRPIIPIAPDKALFASLHLPDQLSNRLGNLTKRIPGRKKFYMALLAVAEVV